MDRLLEEYGYSPVRSSPCKSPFRVDHIRARWTWLGAILFNLDELRWHIWYRWVEESADENERRS